MRSHLGGGWVLVVVAAAVALALYGRAAEREERQELEARVAPSGVGGAGQQAVPLSDELRTLPVGETASEVDGVMEVRVTAGGRPVSRAQVRVYLRGGREPGTGQVNWRIAGAGATGDDGRVVMPARAGAYLVTARAEGLAPAWRELVHPLDGNRTPVQVQLVEGQDFSGRTVAQDTGRPLAGVELTLTPHVSVWEPDAPPDVPAEEQVTGRSDKAGHFHFEGLAPGLYRVEARAPEAPRGAEWSIRVPTDEPRVLALPEPKAEAGRPIPRRPTSKELRCGT